MTDRERGNTDSGPRRVGDARREHEEDRQRRESQLGTSWVSVILGWLSALGASLILSGIVGAIVGGILGAVGLNQQGATSGGLLGLVGVLVTLLLAIIGAVVGASFIDQLTGVTLPGPMQNAAQGIKQPQNLATILSLSGILALLVPFVGGAIGGAWGAKTGRTRP